MHDVSLQVFYESAHHDELLYDVLLYFRAFLHGVRFLSCDDVLLS